jgi:hypothetical protein
MREPDFAVLNGFRYLAPTIKDSESFKARIGWFFLRYVVNEDCLDDTGTLLYQGMVDLRILFTRIPKEEPLTSGMIIHDLKQMRMLEVERIERFLGVATEDCHSMRETNTVEGLRDAAV